MVVSAAGSGGHQHTVLVVDDSEDTRKSLAMLLELRGYRAVTARSGGYALHLILTLGLRPCVMVVDLIMPGMDGLAFRGELAKRGKHSCPIIALSGHEGLRRLVLKQGFVVAVLKPSDLDRLFGLVAQHCAETGFVRQVKRRVGPSITRTAPEPAESPAGRHLDVAVRSGVRNVGKPN
jgi:DNA-binding NtrC family response regulator